MEYGVVSTYTNKWKGQRERIINNNDALVLCLFSIIKMFSKRQGCLDLVIEKSLPCNITRL